MISRPRTVSEQAVQRAADLLEHVNDAQNRGVAGDADGRTLRRFTLRDAIRHAKDGLLEDGAAFAGRTIWGPGWVRMHGDPRNPVGEAQDVAAFFEVVVGECIGNPRQREAVLLHYRDRLTVAEIAKRTGASVETVEQLVTKGLAALRRCWTREELEQQFERYVGRPVSAVYGVESRSFLDVPA